jgi:general secretion pathway protein G
MVNRISRPAAFTLIELLVVLAVIATLLTLVAPRYFHSIDRAKEAVLRENLVSLRDVIDKYHGDKGKYPDSLAALVENRYLRSVPVDPLTDSPTTWIVVPPEDAAKGGVFDVQSGAAGVGSDGRPYRDW